MADVPRCKSSAASAGRGADVQRTVHGHVEHILAELNSSSRVQIAAWVVTHRASA
jgi:hypothetical protein